MEPVYLQQDLKQEIILIVCEWDDEKVVSLYEQNKLDFYVVKVILNQLTNKYREFHKQFRGQSTVELSEDQVAQEENIQARELKEQLEDFTLSEIDNLYWYEAKLVRLYMELGTFRAIEEATKIPYVSCYKTIRKALDILKRKAYQEPAARFVKQTENLRG